MRTLEAWAGRLKPAGVPRLWLLSDPTRLPDPRAAAACLPRGAAVLARGVRPAVLRDLARIARSHGLVLFVGGDGRAALRLRAGLHVPDRTRCAGLAPYLIARRRGVPWARLSVAVHGRQGVARGRVLRAACALVSPVFPTASHPGAAALGILRWAALAGRLAAPAIALGGVDGGNAGRLPWRGAGRAAGLAAIGGLARAQ